MYELTDSHNQVIKIKISKTSAHSLYPHQHILYYSDTHKASQRPQPTAWKHQEHNEIVRILEVMSWQHALEDNTQT